MDLRFAILHYISLKLAGARSGGSRAIVRREIIESRMKARVFVSLKTTVLDPQGQTVRAALNGLGYSAIAEVRQGKFFEIALAEGVTRDQARQDIEAIAHEVLANPVIEEYRIELLDS